MKKILLMLIVATLLICPIACGKQQTTPKDNPNIMNLRDISFDTIGGYEGIREDLERPKHDKSKEYYSLGSEDVKGYGGFMVGAEQVDDSVKEVKDFKGNKSQFNYETSLFDTFLYFDNTITNHEYIDFKDIQIEKYSTTNNSTGEKQEIYAFIYKNNLYSFHFSIENDDPNMCTTEENIEHIINSIELY